MACGLKKNGDRDLGLIWSEVPANAAALFTRNKVQAAPVLLSRERIRSGRCQAVIVNSGNANCCTGQPGDAAAKEMSGHVAGHLNIEDDLVQIASTGVIGEPLAVDRVVAGVPELIKALRPEGFHDLARAIMTTDTRPKAVMQKAAHPGGQYTITAVAKGAGMIRPDMATLLCFACTDADIEPAVLKRILKQAADRSFNRITIDGDTSTNDTVLLLANGLSGLAIADDQQIENFQAVLDELFLDLARQLVADGEGVTKLVTIKVEGAANNMEAARIVDAVSHSPLVKTAFFGEDANWGRIMGAAGRAGASLDPHRIDIYFDDVCMVKDGIGCGETTEALATDVLKKPAFTVFLDLNLGSGRATMLTCDFSVDYVKINADYRS
jgi:glutamate N-acetyltransferase/amino-acid N-acetyltransferase